MRPSKKMRVIKTQRVIAYAPLPAPARRQCPWCESWYVPLRRQALGGEDCRCGHCFRWFWHQEDRRASER